MKKIILIFSLLISANMISAQIIEGLVGYFPFTNGNLTDISGYQNCVLGSNGDSVYYLTEDRFGNPDYAIDFQGAVFNAGSISRNITTEVSVSLWMKTTESPEDIKFLINKYYCIEPPQGYIMAVVGDSVTFDGRDNSSNGYMRSGWSQTVVNDGEWHHIVGLVRSEGVWELWIDAQKENSNSYSPISGLNHSFCSLGIAGQANIVAEPRIYKGALDDIRLYNRALDSLEIVSLFNESDPDGIFSEFMMSSLIPNIYPNPFSTSITIEYNLKKPETVKITFYNQFGKQVDVIEETQPQGLSKVVWTAKKLPDGFYYFKSQAGEEIGTGKMVLIR